VELRSRIFEPYFSTKQLADRPGTGLGLATTYGIVQQHEGTIEVGDAAPRGAHFRVRLPAASEGVSVSRTTTPIRKGTGRILIVEDDEDVRRATRGLLELLGYEVLEAHDGEHALVVFRDRAGEIDVILLDVVMPKQGGRTTLPALRAIREVPVVIT